MSESRPISFSAFGRRVAPTAIARLMKSALENPRLLSLAVGFTDNATLPVEPFCAAVEALARRPGAPEFLQYGTNQGRPLLRERIAARVSRAEGWPADRIAADQIIIGNGSQQILHLAAEVLCEPGDILLIDRPSYFVFLEMLRGLGIEVRTLPVDGAGHLDLAALEASIVRWRASGELARIRGVYFVSYFSNPSGRTLGIDEKRGLAQVLAAEGLVVPVIEDAAYREMGFTGAQPVPSVLALEEWAAFPRLYAGTLTKPFATGLKIGYGCCTDETWRAKMLHAKAGQDFGSANFNQAVLEEVLGNGAFDAHLAQICAGYATKMQVLHEALLAGGLADRGWRWDRPRGGLYLWLTAPAGLDLGGDGAFFRACVEAGVLYVPGELCYGDAPVRNTARLSFGVLAAEELREAARRFCAVAGAR